MAPSKFTDEEAIAILRWEQSSSSEDDSKWDVLVQARKALESRAAKDMLGRWVTSSDHYDGFCVAILYPYLICYFPRKGGGAGMIEIASAELAEGDDPPPHDLIVMPSCETPEAELDFDVIAAKSTLGHRW